MTIEPGDELEDEPGSPVGRRGSRGRALGRLQGLDAATSETRSLLRRGERLEARLLDLDDPRLVEISRAAQESTAALLSALEELRAEERLRLRRQLLGGTD